MFLAAQRLLTALKYQRDIFLYWKYDKAASILYVATGTILDIIYPSKLEALTQCLLSVGPPSTTSAQD